MQTITLEIPDKLSALLDQVCLENGRVKREVIRELLIQYLEDIEDLADAQRIVAEGGETKTLDQVRQELGLDN